MTWQWYVAQAFALVGLVFVVISNQQKTAKALQWYRTVATTSVTIGIIFLGQISAIIMGAAGMLRCLVCLYFAYKPKTKDYIKIIAGVLIVVLLIALNILYWKNWYNLYSIILGSALVFTFLQKKPNIIRILTAICEVFAIIYYGLLITPINVVIETFGLISAIIGIIRLDIKKKPSKDETNDEQNKTLKIESDV